MKIKKLLLLFLTCILNYSSSAQELLDPFGNATTDYYPETSIVLNTISTASTPANVINVIPSPTNSVVELAFDGQYIWVAGWSEFELYQISPINGAIIKTIPIPDILYPAGLTFDGENLWVGDSQDLMLFEIDTTDGRDFN